MVSEIKDQARTPGARNADLHHIALGFFSRRQIVIAVVDLAFQHGGGAHTALATLAVKHRVAAVLNQAVQQALVGSHIPALPGLRQFNREGLVAHFFLRGGEQLK